MSRAHKRWANSGYHPALAPEPYISGENDFCTNTWDDEVIVAGDTVVSYEYENCKYQEFYTAKVLEAYSHKEDDEHVNILTLELLDGSVKKIVSEKLNFYTILKAGDLAL